MKKAWKTFTQTVKRQAVRDMKALVAKGNTVSKARLTVGRALGVTPNTIYNWERSLTGKVTRSNALTKSVTMRSNGPIVTHLDGIIKPHITSVNLHVPGKGNITLDHELLSNISKLAGFIN